MTEEKKWRKSSTHGKDVYHTDKDCHILGTAKNDPVEATESFIHFHELDECEYCASEFNTTKKMTEILKNYENPVNK